MIVHTFFLSLFLTNVLLSSALMRGMKSPYQCVQDLTEYCNIESLPESYEDMFMARICLLKVKAKLSNECTEYLYHENASIVEPCYEDVQTYCEVEEEIAHEAGSIEKCLGRADILPNIHPECKESLQKLASPILSWHSFVSTTAFSYQYIQNFFEIFKVECKTVEHISW